MRNVLISASLAACLLACNSQTTENENEQMNETEMIVADTHSAVAVIGDKNGSGISGTVTFSQTDNYVTMEANIMGLSEGEHAIHIHEKGDCSSPDGKSAGGHWNPTNSEHGEWGSEAFHIGDIGNLKATGDSVTVFTRDTDLWCIGCGDEEKDILGKAIIIHSGADDFTSQPSGAAGERIGCGEIIESEVM